MSNGRSSTEASEALVDGEDLVNRCAEIFAHESGPYKTAKQFSIQNLSETHQHDIDTLLSFRRALTDVGEFFNCLEESNTDRAENKLETIENHLRETACKSANVTPEYYLEKISEDRLHHFLLYKLLLLDAPSKQDFRNKMNAIEDRLERADRKDVSEWEEKISDYQEAHEYASSLYEDIPPARKVRSRVVIMMASVFGSLLSLISFLNAMGLIDSPKIPL